MSAESSPAPHSPARRASDRVRAAAAPIAVAGAVALSASGAALARWQAARGLRADGLVDAVTADTLLGTGSSVPQRRTPA